MVRIGVIGCGAWGRNHLRIFNEHHDAQVAAIVDHDPEPLRLIARRYPAATVYAGTGELLADGRLDAVVIATDAASHADLTRQALLAGKHVLVESPLALELDQARGLSALADDRGLVLMIAHTNLYHPAVRAMRDLVESEQFGPLQYVQSTRANAGPARHGGNALWELAPHDIAILHYLLEAWPLRVSAVGGGCLEKGRQDFGFVTLTYPGGVLASLNFSWVDSRKVRELLLVGSRQRILFDDTTPLEPLRIVDRELDLEPPAASFGEHRSRLRHGDIRSPRIEMIEPLRFQANEFIRSVRRQENPEADGWQGLAVVAVLEAAETSMRRGGAPVDVWIPDGPPAGRIGTALLRRAG